MLSYFAGLDRNVGLLALCQAMFMTITSAIIASAALIGHLLAEDKSWATLPVALMFGATMATVVPASLYMKRAGRRLGFVTGAAIGVVGGSVSTAAIFAGSFWGFAAGSAIVGGFAAFSHFFRFAAADSAGPAMRGKAISLVLAGGLVAAVTGPNLARLTKDLFDPVVYGGTFAALIVIFALIGFVAAFLKIPPMSREEKGGEQRPLFEILAQTRCLVAIIGAVCGYVVMTFMMTVTPLAMQDCGFGFGDSAIVIQAHIVGMFLPSFFTGHLIARFGAPRIMLVGAVLQALCVAVNLAGVAFGNFFAALVVLGVGWNFLFIGGTTLLTECYRPAELAKTQGFNDLCVWGAVAVCALFSGATNHLFGWAVVNLVTLPLICLILLSILWLELDPRRREKAA